MERDRRPGKRADVSHSKSGDSRDPRRRHRHTDLAKVVERTILRNSSNSRPRPPTPHTCQHNEAPAGALSHAKDYVRRWVAQTANDTIREFGEATTRSPAICTQTRGGARSAVADVGSFRNHYELVDEPDLTRRKRRRNSSSDSSLLEAQVRTKPRALNAEIYRHELAASRGAGATLLSKRRRIELLESEVSGPATSSPVPETFERRARHKTREDRYLHDRKKEKAQAKSRPKRHKRRDRCKAGKKAAEDLMRNFSSNNIGQDRLTIRPGSGPGLFGNGKASSPAKRRGLPDLAFAEMDFLEHAKYAEPNMRDKEKRKLSRKQEEISSFFRPRKQPLQELDANRSDQYSWTNCKSQADIYSRQGGTELRHGSGRSRSHDLPSQHSVFPQSESLSGNLSICHRTPQLFRGPLHIIDSRDQTLKNSPIFASWSEGRYSLDPPQTHFIERTMSSTPESVRQSLENTGVFKDTGIRSLSNMNPLDLDMCPDFSATRVRRGANRDHVSSATPTSPAAHPGDAQKETLQRGTRGLVRPRPNSEDCVSDSIKKVQGQDVGAQIMGDAGISQQFNRNSGRHGRPVSCVSKGPTPVAVVRLKSAQGSEITPISRREMAKSARIKRPSTNLPVARVGDDVREQVINEVTAAEAPRESASGRDIINGIRGLGEAGMDTDQRTAMEKGPTHQSATPEVLDGNSSLHDPVRCESNSNEQTTSHAALSKDTCAVPSSSQVLPSLVKAHSTVAEEFHDVSSVQDVSSARYLDLPTKELLWTSYDAVGISDIVQHTRSSNPIGLNSFFIHQAQNSHSVYQGSTYHEPGPTLEYKDEGLAGGDYLLDSTLYDIPEEEETDGISSRGVVYGDEQIFSQAYRETEESVLEDVCNRMTWYPNRPQSYQELPLRDDEEFSAQGPDIHDIGPMNADYIGGEFPHAEEEVYYLLGEPCVDYIDQCIDHYEDRAPYGITGDGDLPGFWRAQRYY